MLAAVPVMTDHHERPVARKLVDARGEARRAESTSSRRSGNSSNSHGSRTSTSTGAARVRVGRASGRARRRPDLRNQNSEPRRRRGVPQRIDHGLEEVLARRRAPGATQRTSRAVIAGASPTTAKTRPPGFEAAARRRRAGSASIRSARSRRTSRVPQPRAPSPTASSTGGTPARASFAVASADKPRVDLDARHPRAQAREQRREVAAAGADLEHALARLELAAPAARAPPSWASTSSAPPAQRNLEIGEGEQRDRRRERIPRGGRRTAGRARPGRAPPTCGSAARPC